MNKDQCWASFNLADHGRSTYQPDSMTDGVQSLQSLEPCRFVFCTIVDININMVLWNTEISSPIRTTCIPKFVEEEVQSFYSSKEIIINPETLQTLEISESMFEEMLYFDNQSLPVSTSEYINKCIYVFSNNQKILDKALESFVFYHTARGSHWNCLSGFSNCKQTIRRWWSYRRGKIKHQERNYFAIPRQFEGITQFVQDDHTMRDFASHVCF